MARLPVASIITPTIEFLRTTTTIAQILTQAAAEYPPASQILAFAMRQGFNARLAMASKNRVDDVPINWVMIEAVSLESFTLKNVMNPF